MATVTSPGQNSIILVNKNMFIDYVDLPTIPEHLLETTNDIIARPPLGVRSTYGIVKTTYDVQRRKIN